MGHQVIQQPDGKFAVFSTYTDTIVLWDATADEVVEHFVEQARADAERHVQLIVDKVGSGNARDIYCQFTMTWGEALEMDREHGGTVHRDFPARPSEPAPNRPDWWTPEHEAAALEGVQDGIAARRGHPT